MTPPILVIGAGPAGLFGAIRLAARHGGKNVTLLERMPKPGRKLLASGSGQCNITHTGSVEEFLTHYGCASTLAKTGAAGRFLRPSLYAFPNHALLEWFENRGIQFVTEENGKTFPADRRASTILNILLDETRRLGTTIEADRRVLHITQTSESDRTPRFTLTACDASGRIYDYQAGSILITTGGASYPGTGSSGDGYTLAASLGHRIIPAHPALVPVFVDDFPLASLAGLSFQNIPLVQRRSGKKIDELRGDLLLTHQGLSGPLILDASRHLEPGDLLEVNFVDTSPEDFRNRLDSVLAANPRKLLSTVLPDTGLPRSLSELICESFAKNANTTCANGSRMTREAICRYATAFPLTVARLGPLDTAMATSGGVDLAEVDPATLESRLVPGLYFAGEVLDFDGDTGGYNLQAAFSTAWSVGGVRPL
jgi:predicted Rossmann fold flavoprotein